MKCFGDKTKTFHTKVVLLDEQELIQEVQETTTGQDLLDVVFQHLNLIETSYFGLRFIDPSHQTHWLDPTKRLTKQLKGTNPFTLYFSVKFYAADPTKLVEEITRYQFFLQIKQDILQGRLPVSQDLAADLGSLAVQSELGDYDPRRHSPGYVSEFRFSTNQSGALEGKVAELHKKLVGQVPAKAELTFLEKVKWLDMYGVDLHPVLGEDSTEYFLGLTPAGIIVLRNKAKVGNYFWPRITKVYFRGRFFMLRVKDKNNEENTYGFETPSKSACKHLWRCCVEHHAFFRLTQAAGNNPQAIFSLGSKYRYSGRTEKEALIDAKIKARPQIEFVRTPSRRYQRRIIEGAPDTPRVEDNESKPQETRTVVSLPTTVLPVSHVYRSTSMTLSPRSDSPRSTRSAPYPANGHVPSSTPSADREGRSWNRADSPKRGQSQPSEKGSGTNDRISRRTSSVESQSSADSRSCSRSCSRHRKSRCRSSDGESEASSKCSSSKGHRRHRHHHRHHHRHRHHSDDSSDTHKHRHRRHRHRSNEKHEPKMIESSHQWASVQAGHTFAKGHTATVRDLSNGYSASGYDETEGDSQNNTNSSRRKHRKHKSPPDPRQKGLPDEIRRHIDFKLQNTDGLTENQLREIPYTKIETNKNVRTKYGSPKRHKSPKRSKSNNSDRKDASKGTQNRKEYDVDKRNAPDGMSLSLLNGMSDPDKDTSFESSGKENDILIKQKPQDGFYGMNGSAKPFPRSSPEFAGMNSRTTESVLQSEKDADLQLSSPLRPFTPHHEYLEDGIHQLAQKERIPDTSHPNFGQKQVLMNGTSRPSLDQAEIRSPFRPASAYLNHDTQSEITGSDSSTYNQQHQRNVNPNNDSPMPIDTNRYMTHQNLSVALHPPTFEDAFQQRPCDSYASHVLREDEEEELSSGFMDSSSGGFMGHPPFVKNGSDRTSAQLPPALKPQPSPQSSVTSGISIGSSSASTAIAEDPEMHSYYIGDCNGTQKTNNQFYVRNRGPVNMYYQTDPNCSSKNQSHGSYSHPSGYILPIRNNLKPRCPTPEEDKTPAVYICDENPHSRINVTHIISSFEGPKTKQSKPILKTFASEDNLIRSGYKDPKPLLQNKFLNKHYEYDISEKNNNYNTYKNNSQKNRVHWNVADHSNDNTFSSMGIMNSDIIHYKNGLNNKNDVKRTSYGEEIRTEL